MTGVQTCALPISTALQPPSAVQSVKIAAVKITFTFLFILVVSPDLLAVFACFTHIFVHQSELPSET